MQKKPRNIIEVLSKNEFFAEIYSEIEKRRIMSKHIDKVLPSYLQGRIIPASIHEGRVVLLIHDNAFAARLRHLAPQIVISLAKNGWKVHALRIRIIPLIATSSRTPQKKTNLSVTALACIKSLILELEPSILRESLVKMIIRNRKSIIQN